MKYVRREAYIWKRWFLAVIFDYFFVKRCISQPKTSQPWKQKIDDSRCISDFVDPVQKAVKVLHDMTPDYLRQLISVLPDSGILLASDLRSP